MTMQTTRPNPFTLTGALAGITALVVACWLRPEWVQDHLSRDGWLTAETVQRIALLRWGLLFGGSVLLVVAGRLTGKIAAWLSGCAVVVAVAVFLNAHYPNSLFFRPARLVRAALGLELALRDFTPVSRLNVPVHRVERARFPAINIHAHLSFPGHDAVKSAEELIAVMDACNVTHAVNLDGGLGNNFRERVSQLTYQAPDRLITFAHVWFSEDFPSPEAFQDMLGKLDETKRLGASGIKIWKHLGLRARDGQGRVVPLDDGRLEPLWAKAEALGFPILIHVGEPEAFFHPIDGRNERYQELVYFGAAGSSLADPRYPRQAQLVEQFERVLDRHPQLTFIAAHMLMLAHDLDALGGVLDRHPNLFVDMAGQTHELGRQPRTARAFFLKYADRILFGTDGSADEHEYRQHFRFLETADEYFKVYGDSFDAYHWSSYALDLPDDVLRQVYHDNAAKILGLPLLADQRARK